MLEIPVFIGYQDAQHHHHLITYQRLIYLISKRTTSGSQQYIGMYADVLRWLACVAHE